LALGLIGEGRVWYKNQLADTAVVFKKEKIKALTIHHREGIAVLNGTSAMTGLGVINHRSMPAG
jgi:histidine ammonia-lyase